MRGHKAISTCCREGDDSRETLYRVVYMMNARQGFERALLLFRAGLSEKPLLDSECKGSGAPGKWLCH